MKNAMISSVFALISLFAGSQAFALECGGMNLKFVGNNGQLYCSKEEAAANDRNRANLFSSNNNTIVMPAQRQPVYVIQQPVHSQQAVLIQQPVHSQQPVLVQQQVGQASSGLTKCEFFGGLVGGALGSASENYPVQATIIGAVVGGVVGNVICTPSQGQPVPQGTTRTLVQQGVQASPQPATVHVPSNCSIDDNPDLQNLRGPTKEQCKAIAGTQKVQGKTQPSVTYGMIPTTSNGNTCSVINQKGEILADFLDATKNPKKIVVAAAVECLKERAEFSATIAQK